MDIKYEIWPIKLTFFTFAVTFDKFILNQGYIPVYKPIYIPVGCGRVNNVCECM